VIRARVVLALWLAGALLLASASGAQEVPRPYRTELRVAHIKGLLVALRDTPPAALQQGIDYARAMERGACSAGAERLRVECLLVAMQRYCHDRSEGDARHCPLMMDLVVSNLLADERLIPRERRYQIIRGNVDYRPALARELHRIQGALAVDFRLHAGDAEEEGAMAANIDRYCLMSADETKLAYQTCVSSLVWFIKGPT
jgi:hypothetical protein